MTPTKRFTADEMEALADEGERNPAVRPFALIFRQSAATERERERVMAALKCEKFLSCHRLAIDGAAFHPIACPACAIRRAAGLEK